MSLVASIIESVPPHSGRLEVWRAPRGCLGTLGTAVATCGINTYGSMKAAGSREV